MKALFRTKEELYNIFLEEGEYYLPPIGKRTIQFLEDVLVGKKVLRKRGDVNRLEDKIKKIWQIVKSRSDLLVRFPDYQGNVLPDKLFLF